MVFPFVCSACFSHLIPNTATQHGWHHPISPDSVFPSLGCLGEAFHLVPRLPFPRFLNEIRKYKWQSKNVILQTLDEEIFHKR